MGQFVSIFLMRAWGCAWGCGIVTVCCVCVLFGALGFVEEGQGGFPITPLGNDGGGVLGNDGVKICHGRSRTTRTRKIQKQNLKRFFGVLGFSSVFSVSVRGKICLQSVKIPKG